MYYLLPIKAFFLGLATVASHFWLLVGYLGQYFIRSSPYTFLLPKKSRKFSPPPPPPPTPLDSIPPSPDGSENSMGPSTPATLA